MKSDQSLSVTLTITSSLHHLITTNHHPKFQTKKSVRDSVDRARLHPIDGSGGWSTIIVSKLKKNYRKRLRMTRHSGVRVSHCMRYASLEIA
jgi:hypothetical protein